MEQDLVTRLVTRAQIRRQIPSRRSVQEGKPDRIADLLDEAAQEIRRLEGELLVRDRQVANLAQLLEAR